jgi:hypothetical protein
MSQSRRARPRRDPSFPKDGDPIPSLSPGEGEILSVCLRSLEDPREVGILHALLSVERRSKTPP